MDRETQLRIQFPGFETPILVECRNAQFFNNEGGGLTKGIPVNRFMITVLGSLLKKLTISVPH
jgi:hypothetical protein